MNNGILNQESEILNQESLITSHQRRHPVISDNNPYNHRYAYERSDRIDGQHNAISRKERYQFACQHDNGSCEDTTGKQNALIGCAEKNTAYMWYGDTYKTYRTAKGSDAAG